MRHLPRTERHPRRRRRARPRAILRGRAGHSLA